MPAGLPAAATLLGEVRAGNAAAMRFEAEAGVAAAAAAAASAASAPGVDAEMEAAMVRLLEERAAKFAESQAVSW